MIQGEQLSYWELIQKWVKFELEETEQLREIKRTNRLLKAFRQEDLKEIYWWSEHLDKENSIYVKVRTVLVMIERSNPDMVGILCIMITEKI